MSVVIPTLRSAGDGMRTASVLLPMSEYEDVEMLALEAASLGKHGSAPNAHVRSWAHYAQEMLGLYRLTTHGLLEIETPRAVERPGASRLPAAGLERQGRIP